ncbi:MAG: site-specific integrase [Alphaproteobacteria bacterium]|nr:site-specific integrase [Alphaproteobacteria bacterium]
MESCEKRQTKNGVSYRFRVRVKGISTTATFKSKTDGKAWATKTEAEILAGHYNLQAKRHTFNELADKYIEHIKSDNMHSGKTFIAQIMVWRDKIGNMALADIDHGIIATKLDEIAQITNNGRPKGPSTVNRYLAVLSMALSYAIKTLNWLENNPAIKVQRRREPQGRVRFLSDDERTRLLNAIKNSKNKLLYPLVVLAISTGARKMEMLSLTWDKVDLDAGWAILEKTKNGDRRGLAITGLALELLKKLYDNRLSDTWVFPNETNSGPCDIRRAWDKALLDAGVQDFRFHDLRHTCASYLIMNGASTGEVANVLGHKSLQMVQRYAHISDQHKAAVVADMNAKIFGDNDANM